jgi:uncharacterized membrane protein
MKIRDFYLEELQELTQNLHSDTKNTLNHYYTLYVDKKMDEGMSRRAVTEEMADPKLVSKRWILYEKLDGLKGQKKKKGSYKLIKEAMDQELISKSFLIGAVLTFILKSALFPALIIALGVVFSAHFGIFIASVIQFNKLWSSALLILLFICLILLVSLRYWRKFYTYFVEDLINRAISCSNLKDFSNENFVFKDDKKVPRYGKGEHVDFMIRE